MRRTERTAAEVPMMTRRMPSRSTRATMASLVACPHTHTQGERGEEGGESVCPHREERKRGSEQGAREDGERGGWMSE